MALNPAKLYIIDFIVHRKHQYLELLKSGTFSE